jgi:hypothetical protein
MADKEITLRNTQRRPIGFCVAGKEVILAPGERMTVPETWMRSVELQRFAGAGFVTSKATRDEELAKGDERGKDRKHAKDEKRRKDEDDAEEDDVKEKARKQKSRHRDED